MWKRIAKYGIAMLLLLWMLPCTVQAEAINTYDTAYPLTIGSTVVDGAAYYVYTNNTQQNELLTISSTLITDVSSDPYVIIYEKTDSGYRQITYNDDFSGRNFRCVVMLQPGKTIYVYARAYSSSGVANYNMHASKESFSDTTSVNGLQVNVSDDSNKVKFFTIPTSGYYSLDMESGNWGNFWLYNLETGQAEYSDYFYTDDKCGPIYLVAGYQYMLIFDIDSADGQVRWKFVKGTDLNDSAITVGPIPAQKYTGEEIEPETKVYYNGKDIEELNGYWYYDEIYNNVDPGTALVEIYYSFYVDEIRNYGYYMTTFDIKKDMSAATVKVGNLVYSGKAVAPSATVTFEGKTLKAGTDYKVVPDKNVNAGTRTATIEGIGTYMGQISVKYVIAKANQTINVADEFIKHKKSKKFALNAKAMGALTYQTSAKKIATVNSAGKVTLKKKYGAANITINAAATQNYNAATKTVKITVTSKSTKLSSVKSTAKKKATVKIKKATGAQGYEISYSMDQAFKSGVKTTTTKKTTATLKKLKSKKTYYVRVRSYRKVSGKKLYSEYSPVKKVKVK